MPGGGVCVKWITEPEMVKSIEPTVGVREREVSSAAQASPQLPLTQQLPESI